MIRRFVDRILDSIAVLVFGPLEGVDYTPEDFEAECALHELAEAVVAEAEGYAREAAESES